MQIIRFRHTLFVYLELDKAVLHVHVLSAASDKKTIVEFQRFPFYIDARRFIKQYGAVAVLAHPFLNLTEEELLEFLPKAKAAGLDAMETIYTEFDEETTAKAKAIAARFGLAQSGGSDFHGEAKPKISLGSGWGNLAVPFSFYEDLEAIAIFPRAD